MITEADLKKFAPKMKAEYKRAFLEGQEILAEAGIFESEFRLAHFMGQFGAETNGGTVIRESLTYTTAKRLRQVWPSRFRDKSDAALRPLLNNPRALGDSVYGGRMGNGRNNGDGYVYRGGGMLQTTGKSAVLKYAGGCGLDCGEELLGSYLDDCSATLRFACLEWVHSKCNDWADENNLRKVSKAINTGSATSNIEPVGMENRKAWFAKAWGIWGGKGKPDVPVKAPDGTLTAMAKLGGPPAVVAAGVSGGVPAPPSLEAVSSWKSFGDSAHDIFTWATASPFLVGAVAVVIGSIWFGPMLLSKIRGTS